MGHTGKSHWASRPHLPPPHLGPFRRHQHSKHSTAHTMKMQPATVPISTGRGTATREMLAWGSVESKNMTTS